MGISDRTPKHVAIIMDGNGRWAERRARPRVFGHIRGASRVREIVESTQSLGVEALTLFAFSTENWSRPQTELDVLWKLLRKFILRESRDLKRKNVRLKVIGQIDRLSPELQDILQSSMESMKDNTGFILTLAISYGGQDDLLKASRCFAQKCLDGEAAPEDLDEAFLSRLLSTGRELGDLAEVDLLIRTSGEKRISNFLLWDLAYSELYFTNECWPDFGTDSLRMAMESYSRRDRRFGSVPGLARRGSLDAEKDIKKEKVL